jgi:alkylation response protein AidB-like acyl-CoA dehydrogenase
MTTLLHERGTLGFQLTAGLEVLLNRLIALAKERGVTDSRLRDMVAREWVELQALKLTNYRALTKLVETGIPGPEGSVSKLHWSEQMQRLSKLAVEIQEGKPDDFWRHTQLRTRGNTIEAGTSEILRNIIAERVLGLPRSR